MLIDMGLMFSSLTYNGVSLAPLVITVGIRLMSDKPLV